MEKTVHRSGLVIFRREFFFWIKTPILVEKVGKFYFFAQKCKKYILFFISACYWSTKIDEAVTNREIFSWA